MTLNIKDHELIFISFANMQMVRASERERETLHQITQ